MFCRVSAAVGAAAIAAMLLAPAQLSARSGAGMAGHAGSFHSPVRPVHRPFVHRHDPLFAHRDFHARHPFEHRRDRKNFSSFVGYGGGYGSDGNGYDGNGYGDNGYADTGYPDAGSGSNFYGAYGYCKNGYGYRYPFACGGYSAFYGRYYDPSDVPGSIWLPPYTVRPASITPIAERLDPPTDRGGCRSETVPVPSPGGAEGIVTITRC